MRGAEDIRKDQKDQNPPFDEEDLPLPALPSHSFARETLARETLARETLLDFIEEDIEDYFEERFGEKYLDLEEEYFEDTYNEH